MALRESKINDKGEVVPTGNKLDLSEFDKDTKILVPGMQIPSFKVGAAMEHEANNRVLFTTWGGIGDQICAEPTLRYAVKNFKRAEIYLATLHPYLFSHIPFKQVFNMRIDRPKASDFLVIDTAVPSEHLICEFMSHMLTNCLDFPAICALRRQLPVAEREVMLVPKTPDEFILSMHARLFDRMVVLHAGRHWPSKTFPKDWWDAVIDSLKEQDAIPVLIGADTDAEKRGTVDVNADGCVDLRNRLTISDSIWWLQNSKVLLTNDSSPLHMAASGSAWIGFIATCKEPENITHWRHGEFGWRMKNHGKGGYWEIYDYCPNMHEEITVDQIEEDLLRSWLPDPKDFAEWAVSKL